jgi:hypothetical protein
LINSISDISESVLLIQIMSNLFNCPKFPLCTKSE